MKCKYCDALLDEDVMVCPVCGKNLAAEEDTFVEEEICEEVAADGDVEETADTDEQIEELVEENLEQTPVKEGVKLAWWKLVLMGVGILAALILFVVVILKDQGIDPNPLNWFADKDVDSAETEYDLNRDDYTAAQEDTEGQAAKIVAKSGDMELDNAQLQLYYWNGVYEFINQYQYYLEGLGLDLSKPLNEQTTIENTTWQKFFLENALFNWHKFSALVHEANESGFELSEATREQLEAMEQDIEDYAKASGYESAADMLTAETGPLVTVDSYLQYCWDYYLAMEYFNAEYNKMQPTDEQIEAYFTEHESELAASGVTKESKLYNVRHILIEPEGGTENEDGTKTYTDSEWEACLKEAQALLDQWKNGDATEESFAQLATSESADGGSSANGGLYTDLSESTSFVQEFKDWYLDESRQVGDTGLVKSVYGYHIMYFSAANTNWQSKCRTALITQMSEQYVQQIMEKWPVTIFDEDIAIGEVTLQQ